QNSEICSNRPINAEFDGTVVRFPGIVVYKVEPFRCCQGGKACFIASVLLDVFNTRHPARRPFVFPRKIPMQPVAVPKIRTYTNICWRGSYDRHTVAIRGGVPAL